MVYRPKYLKKGKDIRLAKQLLRETELISAAFNCPDKLPSIIDIKIDGRIIGRVLSEELSKYQEKLVRTQLEI